MTSIMQASHPADFKPMIDQQSWLGIVEERKERKLAKDEETLESSISTFYPPYLCGMKCLC